MTRRLALAAGLAMAGLGPGCDGGTGTIVLGLATAPGSTVLDSVERLRVTLTNPPATIEAVRGANGRFDLALEVDATGAQGALIVDGFDAGGSLVATGMSPPLAVAALDARVVVYVAFPMSIDRAPVTLTPARDEVSAAPLAYGVVLAGGRDVQTGTPSDALAIYNAYDHTLAAGLPMPGPRTGVALGIGAAGGVYLFGGRDATGAATGTLWRFDTRIAPAGAYGELENQAGFARTGELLVPAGSEQFVATGSPVLELVGGALSARTELAELPPSGIGLTASDGVPIAVFATGTGFVRFRDQVFTTIAGPSLADATVVALPDRAVLAIHPGELVRLDAVTSAVTPTAAPQLTCPRPSAAATSRHVVVACAGETFVFDATTLAQLARLPTAGTALTALPNDQVLLVRDGELALFTPPPPE